MTRRSLSIRASLLGIIGLLNLLLAGIAAYNTLEAVSTLRSAGVYREATTVTNQLFSFANNLSLERGSAMAAIYAAPEDYPQQLGESRRNREEARAALGAAMQTILQREDLKDLRDKAEKAQNTLDVLRQRLDAARQPPRDPVMADEMLAAFNSFMDAVDAVSVRYGGAALSDNPAGARRIRFARAVWWIAEYSGRQYALLGRIIAENKYPTETQQRDLLVWQGRIESAWDLAYGFLETNSWGAAQRPFLDEANTQFGMTFEQIKSIFTYRPSQAAPAYPITAEMWLDMAAQGQDSLHKLTESATQLNRFYIDEQEKEARKGIVFNLFLLLCAFALSLYSWHVIERRVLTPIREMIETMYRAARGDAYELLPVYNADEIGKLGETLRIFQENARQLAIERDRANSANIAKSEFLASMSHEIRTPMNVVLGITSILQMGELSDKQKQLLDTQQRSGEALLALLNDLLDVSKIETHGFQLEQIPFRLDKLIGDVVALLSIKAREKGLPLDARISGVAGRSYLGDPTRLKQILTNLCGNAIKFTARGQVLVSARATPSTRGMETVVIEVTDTGVGIPPDKIDKIFDKFTQADSSVSRHYGGSGLGLAIAKAFAEMMQGTITVQSKQGAGSTFTVTLPLPLHASGQADEAKPEPLPAVSDGQRHSILLVEDYAPNALVATAFLDQLGYRYDTAGSGAQAIEKLRKGDFDAVLMDIQMPGMDGFETTRAIRREEEKAGRRRLRIIGLTAHATFADRDKCFAAGMDDFLAKPFRLADLREKLSDQLGVADL